MKKEIILVFLLLNSIAIIAQKNYVKIGAGIGTLPYETSGGLNVELQYEYKMKTRLSGFLSLGINNRDNFTVQGRSQGNDGTETWDNSYQFKYSERFNYIDAGLKYRVFNSGERYAMKAVLGASLGQSVYNFPDNVFINRGIIEPFETLIWQAQVTGRSLQILVVIWLSVLPLQLNTGQLMAMLFMTTVPSSIMGV